MWMFLALGASVFWGISYALSEQVYKHISVLTSLAITMTVAGVFALVVSISRGVWAKDIQTISSNPKVLILVVAGLVVFIAAELFIGFSIVSKNATVAGLIEISYPIFIALFSYIIFRESNLSVGTALGALLVFLGVGVIYAFNK